MSWTSQQAWNPASRHGRGAMLGWAEQAAWGKDGGLAVWGGAVPIKRNLPLKLVSIPQSMYMHRKGATPCSNPSHRPRHSYGTAPANSRRPDAALPLSLPPLLPLSLLLLLPPLPLPLLSSPLLLLLPPLLLLPLVLLLPLLLLPLLPLLLLLLLPLLLLLLPLPLPLHE